MQDAQVIDFARQAMILMLVLTLPTVLAATITGIAVSLAQALTQLQDQTLSFAIKWIAVLVTLALTLSWMGGELLTYADLVMRAIPGVSP